MQRRRKRDRVRGVAQGVGEIAQGVGGIAQGVGGLAGDTITALGRGVQRGMMMPLPRRRHATAATAGAPAGLTAAQLKKLAPTAPSRVLRVDFNAGAVETQTVTTGPGDAPFEMPPDRLAGGQEPSLTWVTVEGVGDPSVLAAVAERFDVHPLVMEDVVNIPQRPKFEMFQQTSGQQLPLFLVSRLIDRADTGEIRVEQVSLLVGPRTLVAFTEGPVRLWDPVRERLRLKNSRVRRHGTGFLLYTLLDTLVDHFEPVIEFYGDQLLDLEDGVLLDPNQDTIQAIHAVKRDLMLLRREVAPIHAMLRDLQNHESELLDETTVTYLRDVLDHAAHAVEHIDGLRDSANGLADTWMNAMSTKMNEVMKVLTLVTTLFIPASFLAGVFGMNFAEMPLLEHPSGFWIFSGLCVAFSIAMLLWFRHRRWF